MSKSEEYSDLIQFRREALLSSIAYAHEDLGKPWITVVHVWTGVGPGQSHLKELSEVAKEGILSVGETLGEFVVLGICASSIGGGTWGVCRHGQLHDQGEL
ncbi:MAG: hypothetical protein QME90_02645 [Thermodesulfobacteriota bacterium]|nr:hypothetical protein [Thermodesulfobacteriota bacterium]